MGLKFRLDIGIQRIEDIAGKCTAVNMDRIERITVSAGQTRITGIRFAARAVDQTPMSLLPIRNTGRCLSVSISDQIFVGGIFDAGDLP